MMNNMLWYQTLNKPYITPPAWVFTGVWIILYFLMTVSLLLFLKKPSVCSKKLPLTVFFIQLALNILWPYVFFGAQNTELAAAICIILLIFVLLTIRLFYGVSKASAYLLLPYFLWLCLAAYLNIEIVRLNG